MVKWIVIAVSVIGLSVAVFTAATAKEQTNAPPPASAPSINPFTSGIAATGLVEAASRNIEVAPPEPGLVVDVLVEVGARVTAGQPILQLDPRAIKAELIRGRAARELAAARAAQLEAEPRAETIPPLEAALNEAQARARDAEAEFRRASEAMRRDASTTSELDRRRFAADAAKAAAAAAKARLDLARAGAWDKELAVVNASLAAADADIEAWNIRLDRLTVRSPIDGVVLQRNISNGEYASPSNNSGGVLVIGDLSTLHVRALVNEEDAPRLRAGAKAMARARGATTDGLELVPLSMIRIEPLARAKRQLTGVAGELVDTRVIEVLFRVDAQPAPEGLPAGFYPGQLVDVYVDVPAHKAGG